ncbi:hypothetical protein [Leptospira gomenensis]|nr:hypothetical protein [Leptospira gomenensis]
MEKFAIQGESSWSGSVDSFLQAEKTLELHGSASVADGNCL